LKHEIALIKDAVPVSRPAWARGLKPEAKMKGKDNKQSRPAWARGLKRKRIDLADLLRTVAPRVGAWIETGCR